MTQHKYILNVRCPSAAGQVAAVALFLERHHFYVEEISVFDSHDKSTFFVRCVFFDEKNNNLSVSELRQDFHEVATRFNMTWTIYDMSIKPKMMILVSKFDHCLCDLLYRWRIGELAVDITAIVSNHNDLAGIAQQHQLPYHFMPVNAQNREQQESDILSLISSTQTEFVVLARYMQILSLKLCQQLQGRAINIHHSFLPGFKGAKPYQQAYERGVKVIGATAHYVTTDLDEGPIIDQAVTHVDHTYDVEHLQSIGRDMESQALARAVRLHIERRVFLDGFKTVVLR